MEPIDETYHEHVSTFDATYAAWSPKIYRYILKKSQSTYLAEEIVQRFFTRIWERREDPAIFLLTEAQVFFMVRNLFIDELRRQAKLREVKENWQKETPVMYTDDRLEQRERLQNVYAEIEKMPPMRQRVFRMSRFEHFTYKEIASKLSVSVRTVENHIAAALKALRQHNLDLILLAGFIIF